jgi:N-acyl-D-aspartate/D-glutamate deacylase
MNPFMTTDAYRSLADLPLAERVARLKDPAVRERILGEYTEVRGVPLLTPVTRALHKVYRLGDPPDYEPDPSTSMAAEAERKGVSVVEHIYDTLLEDGGHELLYCPISNYTESNFDALREMIISERTLFGLSDAGAHVGTICDGSFPTFNLTHWVRDRSRGERLPLEAVVKGQTHDTARYAGWDDRGLLSPGYRADQNVIDYDALRLRRPEMVYDLPAGGRRLLQRAEGYRYMVKSGEVTFEDGEATGALPGRLVRGPQPAPR